MSLIVTPNFKDNTQPTFREFTPGDNFYEALIEAHRDLTDEQSQSLNSQLVLLLANHIGDLSVIKEALAIARAGALQK